MKYEIPQMLKQPGSAIVNCSSVAGLVGFAGLPAYGFPNMRCWNTKAAALRICHTRAKGKCRVPQVIHTAMIDRITGNDEKLKSNSLNWNRSAEWARLGEIAEAVVWLCSGLPHLPQGRLAGGWWFCSQVINERSAGLYEQSWKNST